MLFIFNFYFNRNLNCNFIISYVLVIIFSMFWYWSDTLYLDISYCFIFFSSPLFDSMTFLPNRKKQESKSFESNFANHMKLIEEKNQQLSPFDLEKEHFHLTIEQINMLDAKYNYDSKLSYYHHPDLNFIQWLVGFTDGEGDFVVSLRKAKDGINYNTVHEYRLTQSLYNIRCLLFIQDMLGCGQIRPVHPSGKNNKNYPGVRFIDWVYRFTIQDKFSIMNTVIPVFTIYPLLTFKYYYYTLFYSMFFETRPSYLYEYKAKYLIKPTNFKINHDNVITKSWIVGFIEAEGSFFIKNDKGKYVHEFSITQVTDTFLLMHIREVFGITSSITTEKVDKSTNTANKLRTNSKPSIEAIIQYLGNYLVGTKRFEFKLWADSYLAKESGKPYDLKEVQLYLRFLRDRHKVMHHLKNKSKQLQE